MRSCRASKPGRYNLILCVSGVILLCLFGMQSVWADDALSVKRDSDKTVYTIGASDEKNNALDAQSDKEKNVYSIGSSKEKRDEEALKQERSWGVLMNMGIVIDKRQGKPAQGQSSQDRPAQDQTSQPASGK